MRCVTGHRFFERHSTALGLAAYAGAIVVGLLTVAAGVEAFVNSVFDAPAKSVLPATVQSSAVPQFERKGALVLTQDNWSDMLRDPAYWASRKVGGNKGSNGGTFWKSPAPPSPPVERASLGVFAPPARNAPKAGRDDSGGDTYRTVCVRLCDGSFFPLSFATTREHFEDDAAKCERTCGSASRMFFYKNPGAEPEDMEDLEGRPYKKLATAFLYKTQYVEQCKCKPHPWEEASLVRHQVYALEAARAKGNKLADAPLKDLKAKLRQAELDTQAEKRRLAQAKIDDQKRVTEDVKVSKASTRKAGSGKPPVVAAGLPPPSNPEPTALYQPPAGPATGSMASTKTVQKSTPNTNLSTPTSVVILRAGASQTKSVRVTTPAGVKTWTPGADLR